MTTKLRPLSDLDREFLQAIGDTGSSHQEQVQKIIRKTYNKDIDTRRSVHSINEDVEKDLTFSEPTSLLVRRMEEREEAGESEAWVSIAYSIFIRRWTCACGNQGTCMDSHQTYIKQRKLKEDPEKTRRYLPVRSLDYTNLPRLKEVVLRTQPFCEECLEGTVVQFPSAPLPITLLRDLAAKFEIKEKEALCG